MLNRIAAHRAGSPPALRILAGQISDPEGHRWIFFTGIAFSCPWLRAWILEKSSISVPAAVLFYGLFWALGFTVKAIGERIKWIRAYPSDETYTQFQQRLATWKSLDLPLDVKVQRERYVVIKETMGNFSFSLFISATVVILSYAPEPFGIVLLFAVGGFSLYCVWWFQIEHQRRQRDYEVAQLAKFSAGGATPGI